MGEWVDIHRAVSIAGRVLNAATQQPLSGAIISVTKGPEEFDERLQILSRQPDWKARTTRLDRTVSRPDGMYWLMGLPNGVYTLRVSIPQMGSRFGTVAVSGIRVWATRDEDGRIKLDPADASLPPTMIHGTVTHLTTHKPIGKAKVRLLGTSEVITTQADGTFRLTDLVAGNPTVEASAPSFRPVTKHIALAAGQDVEVTLELVPL